MWQKQTSCRLVDSHVIASVKAARKSLDRAASFRSHFSSSTRHQDNMSGALGLGGYSSSDDEDESIAPVSKPNQVQPDYTISRKRADGC